MQIEEPAGERRGAVIEVRPLQRDRGFVRDRGEKLEVAFVVRGGAAALRRDRADERVALPERRDDDRLFDHVAPGLEVRQPEAPRVALDLLQ